MKDLHLVSIMLISISSSLDNFGVGISYGLRNICIPLSINVAIALVNSSGTFFSMLFGKWIMTVLKPDSAGYVGALLLMGIGTWIVSIELRKKRYETPIPYLSPEITDAEKKNIISKMFSLIDDPFQEGILCMDRLRIKEGALLAFALTLSNISTGIAAGMLGFSLAITTAAAFIFNVLAITLGQRAGHISNAGMIKGASGIAAGLLLVCIGFYEMIF